MALFARRNLDNLPCLLLFSDNRIKEILTHPGPKKTGVTEQSISKTLHIYLMLSEVEEQGKREYLLDTEVSHYHHFTTLTKYLFFSHFAAKYTLKQRYFCFQTSLQQKYNTNDPKTDTLSKTKLNSTT